MPDEAATLPLIRGTTTLKSALEQEEDMLLDLSYPEQRIDFFVALRKEREEIAKLASYHLGLDSSDTCKLGEVNEWIHGSFNVCIPVYVGNQNREPERRAVIRFPLPYKVGEHTHPGNVDEKLRCEVATYVWIEDNCPDVSIPQLWGFGFPSGLCYTKPEYTPLATRISWYLKRWVSWLFGHTLPIPYVCHRRSILRELGYLVLEHVGNSEVQMLSSTWNAHRQDEEKRRNLYKGLSRIMLSLSRIPLPRIGSWTLDTNGVLQLSNRPLSFVYHQLENGGIPTNIDRTMTYPTADAYYLDLLGCHDSRIRYQPNSLFSIDDGRAQMARLTIMRALLPHFTQRGLREGPFFFRLTDLHPSNILVDGQWNVRKIIDLEWACSLPAETLHPPYWLTDQPIDLLIEENLEAFTQTYQEFMGIFEEEESSQSCPPISNACSVHNRTSLMRRGWQAGNFWYFHALGSTKGLFNIFDQHILPIFTSGHRSGFSQILSEFWAADAGTVLSTKLHDKEEYEQRLRRLFEHAAESTED